MALYLSSAPAAEPVTTAEAKVECRITAAITAYDGLIDRLIASARQLYEREIRRALITQTWILTQSGFPSTRQSLFYRRIPLPRPPLQTVASITYTDAEGNSGQSWDSSNYTVVTRSEPGFVDLGIAKSYPSTHPEVAEAVVITYVAGQGAASTNVRDDDRQAILTLVRLWFEDPDMRSSSAIPSSVQRVINGRRCGFRFGQYGVTW